MYWRLGGAYRGRREENKETLRKIVRRGPSPGLLAFNGDLPVGWCQLTPRDALPWLDRMWWFQRVPGRYEAPERLRRPDRGGVGRPE